MNRQEWKLFYRWLETASLPELRVILAKTEEVILILQDPDVREDALRMRREIESEILSRTVRP